MARIHGSRFMTSDQSTTKRQWTWRAGGCTLGGFGEFLSGLARGVLVVADAGRLRVQRASKAPQVKLYRGVPTSDLNLGMQPRVEDKEGEAFTFPLLQRGLHA